MKKKPPVAAPAPTKAPDPPAKQAAPPQPAPAPKAPGDTKKNPEAATPTPAEQGTDLSEVPVTSAEKPPDEKASDSPAPDPQKKAKVPADPIDWMAMRQPFLDRGLPLTSRDGDQIRQNFSMSYNQLVGFGFGPSLSTKIANLGTPLAYDFALARDNPTQIEKFDMETERMLGPGKKLGKLVVPVITPATMSWAVETLTGKKIDFHF